MSTGSSLRKAGLYKVPGVEKDLIAVSTVLNSYDKDASEAQTYWVAKKCAELVEAAKRREKFPRWTYVFNDGIGAWHMDEADPRDLMLDTEWLQQEAKRELQRAAERGMVCHDLAEVWQNPETRRDIGVEYVPHWVENQIEKRGFNVHPDKVVPYADSLWRWLDKYNPQFLVSEHTVFHEGLGYAGTLDGIMELGGKLWVVDFKATSATYDRHALQLAAYRHAKHVVLESGDVIEMPRTNGAAIVHVKPQGCVFRTEGRTYPTFMDFRRILRVYLRREDEHKGLGTIQDYSIHKREMDDLREGVMTLEETA